jgi:phosphatidylglycerol:prolipoprotein diacylglycerol transferase
MVFQSPGPIIFKIGFLTVRWYGLLIYLGMLLTVYCAIKLAKSRGLDKETIINLALICFLSGIVGARLYYVFLNLSHFLVYPSEIGAVWNGGLSIHGGIVGGALAGMFYLRRKKLPVLKYLDIMAASTPVAQAIGRWGNFFNSEAFGLPVQDNFPLKLFIPPESRPNAYHANNYFHPTFLYESVWNLLLFYVLYFWVSKNTTRYPGMTTCLYLAGYSLGRLLIEPIRVDAIAYYLGMPIPFLVSAATIGIALCAASYISRHPQPQTPGQQAAEPDPANTSRPTGSENQA